MIGLQTRDERARLAGFRNYAEYVSGRCVCGRTLDNDYVEGPASVCPQCRERWIACGCDWACERIGGGGSC